LDTKPEESSDLSRPLAGKNDVRFVLYRHA
jgi:hypothetical protein